MQRHARKDENINSSGARTAQRTRTFLHGGSCSQDIVNEQNAAAADHSAIGHRESARQIAPSLPFVQSYLWSGRPIALQGGRRHGESTPPGEVPRQQQSLVESPPAQSINMQRHGNENFMTRGQRAPVRENASNRRRESHISTVFVAV